MLAPKRFKTGRRLGPSVYDQCQTERFALSEARKKRAMVKDKHKKSISPYNIALKDKQRVRLYYGITERQFARYVKEATAKTGNPIDALHARLETRLDNAVYRIGLAPTHRAARQMVAHGHITVNGKKIRVPSHILSIGDLVAVRQGSLTKGPFVKKEGAEESTQTLPQWLSFNEKKGAWQIDDLPRPEVGTGFNLGSVIEFYSR